MAQQGENAVFLTSNQWSRPNTHYDVPGFFTTIGDLYGDHTVQLLKHFSRLNIELAKQKNRRIFLLRCRHSELTPTFLNFKTEHLNFKCKYLGGEFERSLQRFKSHTINLTISDTCKNIRNVERKLTVLKNNIQNSISHNLFAYFMDSQGFKYERIFNDIKHKNIRKVNNLVQKTFHNSTSDNSRDGNNFVDNISNTQLPNYVTEILSLGPKFSLPLQNDVNIPIHNIIASVEDAIREQPLEVANDIRTKVTTTITNHKNKMKSTGNKINKNKRQLLINCKKTKIFLKNNPQLIVAQSDKSNKTIVMDATTYNDKCFQLLNDQNTYTEIKTDPTNVTQNKNNNLIKEWKNKQYITQNEAKQLTIHNAHPPKFYALLKTHKPNLPIRPIVSNNQAPLYHLSKFLADSIKNIVGQNDYYIKNSFDFKKYIDQVHIPDNYILISLDVTSLYTNIPINLVEHIVHEQWQNLKNFTTLPEQEFQKALKFTLTTNFFQFKDKFYKQLDGVAMGSPISSVIAQLVMEHVEKQIIAKLDTDILFYKRYVDDCLLAIPRDSEQQVLDTFNSFHHKLQFTLEVEKNRQINFLDLTLIRENNHIHTKWYTKSVSSGRYLNYNSEHHKIHKKNVITAIIDRSIKLTTAKYRQETINKAKNLLSINGYPPHLINSITKRRVHAFYNSLNRGVLSQSSEPLKYSSIPYVNGLSEKLEHIFQHHNISITHKSHNHVKQFFTKLKSKTPKMKQTHIVYKIPCEDCNKVYIGQSLQYLQERIKAHKYAKNASTALTKHKVETDHTFNYQNTSILAIEHNTFKRNIKEMIHINLDGNALNSKSEINNLSKIYQSILS